MKKQRNYMVFLGLAVALLLMAMCIIGCGPKPTPPPVEPTGPPPTTSPEVTPTETPTTPESPSPETSESPTETPTETPETPPSESPSPGGPPEGTPPGSPSPGGPPPGSPGPPGTSTPIQPRGELPKVGAYGLPPLLLEFKPHKAIKDESENTMFQAMMVLGPSLKAEQKTKVKSILKNLTDAETDFRLFYGSVPELFTEAQKKVFEKAKVEGEAAEKAMQEKAAKETPKPGKEGAQPQGEQPEKIVASALTLLEKAAGKKAADIPKEPLTESAKPEWVFPHVIAKAIIEMDKNPATKLTKEQATKILPYMQIAFNFHYGKLFQQAREEFYGKVLTEKEVKKVSENAKKWQTEKGLPTLFGMNVHEIAAKIDPVLK